VVFPSGLPTTPYRQGFDEAGGAEARGVAWSDMLIVDAHQHFWDPSRTEYPWLPRNYPELEKKFDFPDLAPHLAAAGVSATVLVQSADNWADTEFMFEVAGRHPEVAGVVAWAPLDDPPTAARLLEDLSKRERFCGVRNLIHDREDPDWVLRPDVSEGLGLLEAAGVPFDYVAVLPRHLEHVPTLCERFGRLRVVIDHLAKPPVGTTRLGPWKSLMSRAASSSNVFAKVSGLYPLERGSQASRDDLRPFFDHAVDVFGPSRLMFGSDWPICEVAGGYQAVVGTLLSLIRELDEQSQTLMLSATAKEFYHLRLPGDASPASNRP